MGLYTEKSGMDQTSSVPWWSQKIKSYILYKYHNAIGHKGSTRLYIVIKKNVITGRNFARIITCMWGLVQSVSELLSKNPWYINLHLPIPQFPMAFIGMDLLYPYSEMESGNQYALIIICMLTNYVFMTPIKTKTTEDVIINAYLKHVYATFSSSKYIHSDRGSRFFCKQFTWLANELGFTKVYTSSYIPTGNSVIERTHSFLKASWQKIISNHDTDWDSIAHIVAVACNVFPHFSTGEALFYLMCSQDAFIPTLFKLLMPKIRYIGDKKLSYTFWCHEGNVYDDGNESWNSKRQMFTSH